MAKRLPKSYGETAAVENATSSRTFRGERGSVLMEGILVLPLYLMALGVLFILGDLARSRQTLLAAERAIVWLAADRFEEHKSVGIAKMLLSFLDVSPESLPGGVFEDVVGGKPGYLVLPVETPYWCGMANEEFVMDSRGNSEIGEMPFKDSYLVPEGKDGKGDRHMRHYVVRRRPDEADELYDRNAPGAALVGRVMNNVVKEPWIVGGTEGHHDLPKPASDKPVKPYAREHDLVVFGE